MLKDLTRTSRIINAPKNAENYSSVFPLYKAEKLTNGNIKN